MQELLINGLKISVFALGDRKPDYLIVSHMEPDHASNIQKAREAYPDMKIVGNAKTFPMMAQFLI